MQRLGYEVTIPQHLESARTWLSKGLVRKAREIINQNIRLLASLVTDEIPLIGIEPSAILSFRDEYIDLAEDDLFETAKRLSKQTFMIDEFLASEIDKGTIRKEQFTTKKRKIKLHGH